MLLLKAFLPWLFSPLVSLTVQTRAAPSERHVNRLADGHLVRAAEHRTVRRPRHGIAAREHRERAHRVERRAQRGKALPPLPRPAFPQARRDSSACSRAAGACPAMKAIGSRSTRFCSKCGQPFAQLRKGGFRSVLVMPRSSAVSRARSVIPVGHGDLRGVRRRGRPRGPRQSRRW